MSARTYRAVCFDLDGTLLSQDLDEFLGGYFSALSAFMASSGVPSDVFKAALGAGIKAMTTHEDQLSNEQVYWDTFMATLQALAGDTFKTLEEWMQLFLDFYLGKFGEVGKGVDPNPHMVAAVAQLAAKGYPILLTTMPLFPPEAVDWRLKWAGLSADSFQRITTYDNSTSAKPKLRYYAENLAAMGLSGEDVLMVGNNTVEDYAFTKLGADAYLVTDLLLDPVDMDLSAVKHGNSAEFLEWVRALEPCQNPVEGVNPGMVPAALTDAALEENYQPSEDVQAQMAEAAKRSAALNEKHGKAAIMASSENAGYVPLGMDHLN